MRTAGSKTMHGAVFMEWSLPTQRWGFSNRARREESVKIAGIDPGVHGGIAVISVTNGTAPVLLDAIDIPIVGSGAKQRVDAIAVRKWLVLHQPTHAAVERGQALPRQGASSGFLYGRACGALEATVASLEIPMLFVEPSVWKRRLHLRGKDKEGARQLALQLFPHAHHLLARKKDHGRSEAALLALACDFVRSPPHLEQADSGATWVRTNATA
jgi:crossover junction endodeoxyribonuclease RuvC